MRQRAFVLIELVAGIMILGIISIACSKILLELRKKRTFFLLVSRKSYQSRSWFITNRAFIRKCQAD